MQSPQFFYDIKNYFPEATSFLLTGENLKQLTALLNSKFLFVCFKLFYMGGELGKKGIRYKKKFLENLPIAKVSDTQKNEIEKMVDKVLKAKKSNLDITKLEQDINQIVYKIYDLTPEEIKFIEEY